MTPLDLIFELEKKLAAELSKFQLPAQNSPPQQVKVYALKLPNENVLNPSLYPCVVLELVGTTDDAPNEPSTAQLLLTVGNYATYNSINGAQDNLNILEAARQFLLTHQLIGGASLQYPLESLVVESTAEDFFFSQILATYKIFSIENNYLEV